jgi:Ca-activated chloride channel family protein
VNRLVPAVLALVAVALIVATTQGPFAQDAQQRKGFAITITAPENQEVVFGKVKIAADVRIDDPALIDRVEFLLADEVLFIDREAPFEFRHDFGEESRSWIIRAVAYHAEGVSVSDAVITRRLDLGAVEKVNRVILWVSATDKDDNFISDLSKEDFKLYEDGREQKVIDFYVEERPITMGILVDTSTSMQDKIKEVHKAAGSFVETLREIDQAMIIDFDESVFLIQDLTSDTELLKAAVTSTEPLGATAIYDALHAAYRKIGKMDGRKAIILLSDGEDTSSQFGFDRVLEEAKLSNSLIYSIGIGGSYGARKNILKEFAEVTGGNFFFVKKATELGKVYERIAEELGRQFYLTYSTTNETWDGRWVKIKVESTRPGIKIRARRGYFAVKASTIGS